MSTDRIEFDKPVTIKTETFIGFGRAFRIEDGEVFYFRSDKPLNVGEEIFLKLELPRAKMPLSCYVRIERTGSAGEGQRGYVARLSQISKANAGRFDHWLRYMSGGGSSLRPDLVVDEEGESFDMRMNSATKDQVRSELRRLDAALGTSRRSKDPYGFQLHDRTYKAVDTQAIVSALRGVETGSGRKVTRKVRRPRRAREAAPVAVDEVDFSALLPRLSEGEGVAAIDYDELLEEAEADNRLDEVLEEAVSSDLDQEDPLDEPLADDEELVDEEEEDSWDEDSWDEPSDPRVLLGEPIVVHWSERSALKRDFQAFLREKRLRLAGSAPSKTPSVRLELPDGQVMALRSRLESQEANHFELRLDLNLAAKGKLKRAADGPPD